MLNVLLFPIFNGGGRNASVIQTASLAKKFGPEKLPTLLIFHRLFLTLAEDDNPDYDGPDGATVEEEAGAVEDAVHCHGEGSTLGTFK
jgi:hypothetical protein